VAVDEHGGLALIHDVLGVHDGVPLGGDDLGALDADVAQVVGQPIRRALDLVGILRVRADRRDAQ
jgi:hypothetical protein